MHKRLGTTSVLNCQLGLLQAEQPWQGIPAPLCLETPCFWNLISSEVKARIEGSLLSLLNTASISLVGASSPFAMWSGIAINLCKLCLQQYHISSTYTCTCICIHFPAVVLGVCATDFISAGHTICCAELACKKGSAHSIYSVLLLNADSASPNAHAHTGN